ncbi:hypothetical protein ACGFZL_06395 [Streptomyces sp. NPDC048182]|uniref:hypothetical protein n=1 Tax=Streptomyces sp. NPDC048182 TaxID=3365507 RepID=UPI00371C9DA3
MQFVLGAYRQQKVHGRTGIVGEFGEVTYTVERRKGAVRRSGPHYEVRLHGERVPEVLYRTIGPGRATLTNARLSVDGEPVSMMFNSRAFRSSSRALHLQYAERTYEYVVRGFERGSVLSRPGVQVVITHGKSPYGKGMSAFGTATGDADGIDLALAIVFEGVDTQELTPSGAVSDALNRLLLSSNETPVD